MSEIVLSKSDQNRLNQSKRRPFQPENHKSFVRKKNRNSGLPYKGKNGQFHPGLMPPTGVKLCGPCRKIGCLITEAEKQDLYNQYRNSDYNTQTGILIRCIEVVEPENRVVPAGNSRKMFSYKYSISLHGRKMNVCKRTLKQIFKVTEDRIRTAISKLRDGELCPKDQRGKHENPHKTAEATREAVRAHIRSFPTYESHYTQNAGNPLRLYLAPELTISRMHKLFIEEQRLNQGPECNEWLYRQTFKTEFTLRIGNPKQDTCDTCDSLKSSLQTPNTAERLEAINLDWDLHRAMSGDALNAYKQDIQLAKSNGNLDQRCIVITADLQQVLFTPTLNNSSSFYLRKLSNFNFGIHDESNGTAVMNLWTETTARRGSNEIASCIWKFISSMGILRQNQERNLILWTDRCIGQNNNFIITSMLILLVLKKYITSFSHKFFVTGHSYNSCDRDFGLVEAIKKKTPVLIPSQLDDIIYRARTENPFDSRWLTRTDFLDFKTFMMQNIGRPSALKVTQFLVFNYDIRTPSDLLTRKHHGTGIWERYRLRKLTTPEMRQTVTSLPIPAAYPGPIALDGSKANDLRKLTRFLHGAARQYYLDLLATPGQTIGNESEDENTEN